MHSGLNCRLITDWTFENMYPDVTLWSRMWLDVSASPIKIIKKTTFILAPSHHKCNRYEGICQKKHIACDGVYIKGLCCGGEHIQCCLAGGRKCYIVSDMYSSDMMCAEQSANFGWTRCSRGGTDIYRTVYWIAKKIFYLLLIFILVSLDTRVLSMENTLQL